MILMFLHTRRLRVEMEALRVNIIELKEEVESNETYLLYYAFMHYAEVFAEREEFNAAITMYENANKIAHALSFSDGVERSAAGIDEMNIQLLIAKQKEAEKLISEGDMLFDGGRYRQALEYYNKAVGIYLKLEDEESVTELKARIEYVEQYLHNESAGITGDTPQVTDTLDEADALAGAEMNYEHNIKINFDLTVPIDYQNQSPANEIKMGSREGMNEGWYNGCGWVATYNALLILGNPIHPAEIVHRFETKGGIVLGGVFGTYPNAISDYLQELGYTTKHSLFPQLTQNIDDVIKNSKVAVLAYMHTRAAHYVLIEYREDIGKFIVYNDRFAREMSAELGYSNYTQKGAAIDSVSALINNTGEILFSFSLIVVS